MSIEISADHVVVPGIMESFVISISSQLTGTTPLSGDPSNAHECRVHVFDILLFPRKKFVGNRKLFNDTTPLAIAAVLDQPRALVNHLCKCAKIPTGMVMLDGTFLGEIDRAIILLTDLFFDAL